MSATLTSLQVLLNRMKRFQTESTTEDIYIVRDLDEAIRNLRRKIQLPWTLQHSSLRVFQDVYEYPVAADHDELAFLDSSKNTMIYEDRARFRFTSVQQFWENPDYRNQLAEIFDGNSRYLGIKYNRDWDTATASGQLINGAESLTGWTSSGDAGTLVLDTVNFKEGNSSIRVPIVDTTGVANVDTAITSFVDSNYMRKYFFVWVYLDAAPTSIVLRLGADSSNYYYQTVTAQFSGQAFKADQWNLLAMDMNTALSGGTPTTTFAYQGITFNGADTGTYYIDSSYLRQWELLDYWYYSKYNIALTGSTVANQEYFLNDAEVWSADSSLVGDSEWSDVVMYEGLCTGLADKADDKLWQKILAKRQDAWDDLMKLYPSMQPLIITSNYRFQTDFNFNGKRRP